MDKITRNIRNIVGKNNLAYPETVAINNRRIFYVAVIAVPVSLAHIIAFLFFTPADSETELLWRSGILLSHIILGAMMLLLGLAGFYCRRKLRFRVLHNSMQYITILFLLGIGIFIVAVDQLVTPSITPFLIACTVSAVVFLLRPLIAVLIYLFAYSMYYFALTVTQTDEAILLSNQINGLAAIGIAIGLTWILWNNNIQNFYQKVFIEKQQKELEEKNIRLSYLASYDSMTGLMNRREFHRTVDHEISMMKRFQYDSVLLISDIDHFKKINDRYGHPCGDKLLVEYAMVLTKHLRDIDILARWGGEEFIVLLPRITVKEGAVVAERLRKGIESHDFCVEANLIKMTASFGIAQVLPSGSQSFASSYKNADKALYSAKKNGRNCVETYIKSHDGSRNTSE